MIVRRFLAWTHTAGARQRAQGANALARAYLQAPLRPDEHREALIALTALLDDTSPLVRRALAEALGASAGAPHHIVATLAADQPDIAAIVLARSPLLGDAELIDHAALGGTIAQSAIASRMSLSAPVAAALAEVGEREAVIRLATNPRANLPDFALRRIVERLGDDGEVREAVLARPQLSAALRHDLVLAAARSLTDFVVGKGWLTETRAGHLAKEACEQAAVAISMEDESARVLVGHLRRSGHLTAGLILRALLSGNVRFIEAALAELSRLTPEKISGLMREFDGPGFAALYRKAGLPMHLLPVVRAGLAAARQFVGSSGNGRLSRPIVDAVMHTVINGGPPRVMALLCRFESEAAREEARDLASGIIREMRFEAACDISAALEVADLAPEMEAIASSPATAPLLEAA